MATRPSKTTRSNLNSPRRVYNDSGEIVEVILDYRDYRTLLRKLAEETDWEALPRHLQDAVDALLMEEVEAEHSKARPLRKLLQETGESPGS